MYIIYANFFNQLQQRNNPPDKPELPSYPSGQVLVGSSSTIILSPPLEIYAKLEAMFPSQIILAPTLQTAYLWVERTQRFLLVLELLEQLRLRGEPASAAATAAVRGLGPAATAAAAGA